MSAGMPVRADTWVPLVDVVAQQERTVGALTEARKWS